MSLLHEIRCPNVIIAKDNKVYPCNALLCKATEGSKLEIVCRKCKRKMTIVIKPGLGMNPEIAIKQDNNEAYED